MNSLMIILLSGLAVAVFLAVLAVVLRLNRRRSRQRRLDVAFARAARVRFTGTGEQGRPYSVYTDRINRD